MNRRNLLDACSRIDLRRLSETEQRVDLEFLLEDIFSALKTDGREPDLWEKTRFAKALGALRQGAHGLARCHIARSLVPPGQRARPDDGDQLFMNSSLRDFELGLIVLQGEPLGPWARNRESWARAHGPKETFDGPRPA